MSPLNELIINETIQRINDQYPELLDALYDPQATTRKGRIKYSTISTKLGITPNQAKEMLQDVKKIIDGDS